MVDITLDGLGKRFGAITAVEDLSLEIKPGNVTAFLGPNGAGKTTTIRMVLGLVRPTSGRALIGGRPYSQLLEPRRAVGAVLGPDGFHPGRSGRDHLRVIARAARISAGRIDEVLELVELTAAADRRVGTYSLGMRQRLGLDPEGIAWLRGFLRSIADDGRTVLVSSHLLAEVARTADRIVVIGEGRLRFDGDLAELAGPAGPGDADALENAFLRLTVGAAA